MAPKTWSEPSSHLHATSEHDHPGDGEAKPCGNQHLRPIVGYREMGFMWAKQCHVYHPFGNGLYLFMVMTGEWPIIILALPTWVHSGTCVVPPRVAIFPTGGGPLQLYTIVKAIFCILRIPGNKQFCAGK